MYDVNVPGKVLLYLSYLYHGCRLEHLTWFLVYLTMSAFQHCWQCLVQRNFFTTNNPHLI